MDGERLRRSPRKHGSTSSRSDPEPQTEPESDDNVFGETDVQQTPRSPRRGLALRTAPNLSYPHQDLRRRLHTLKRSAKPQPNFYIWLKNW
ncbi:hypothetical protein BFJ69_g17507 [Fusarium oxysporum]|uniref:Uncharacterized protein n=1 Tax=Fusarium oxysporum TaxID=5507 RepID=A0A420M842_FUSOX|nr:hypothetical protein BFJ69_g17507 [Fusarium oxysporum]